MAGLGCFVMAVGIDFIEGVPNYGNIPSLNFLSEDNALHRHYGKAVEETRNERQEFKMSKASLELLGVKFVEVKAIARGIFLIPNSSVVSYQDNFGIYISEDGWFKLVTVEKKSTNESHTKIYSSLLKPTTKIVSKGLDFVRIAHVHLISTNHEEEEEGEED